MSINLVQMKLFSATTITDRDYWLVLQDECSNLRIGDAAPQPLLLCHKTPPGLCYLRQLVGVLVS